MITCALFLSLLVSHSRHAVHSIDVKEPEGALPLSFLTTRKQSDNVDLQGFQPQRHYLPLLLLPNLSVIRENFGDVVTNSLGGLTSRKNLTVPLNRIINATISNDEKFPEIIPEQSGPLPTFDDFYCNPKLFPHGCVTLDELGKAFGVPLNDWFMGSVFGSAQRAFGNTLLSVFNRATRGITPSLVNYVHQSARMNAIIGSLERIFNPVFATPENSTFWKTWSNLTHLLLWDALNALDPEEVRGTTMESYKQLLKAAIYCRLFNGRLPYCDHLVPFTPPVPPNITAFSKPPSKEIDPKTGYRKEVQLSGVAESCAKLWDNCYIAGDNTEPQEFDGNYKFAGLDNLGFPLYHKRHVKFAKFGNVKSLWLTVTGLIGPAFPYGITAAVLPNTPTYMGVGVQSRIPLLAVLGKPPGCKYASDFPLCLSDFAPVTSKAVSNTQPDAGWFLGRVSLTGCPVPRDRFNGICKLHINPAVMEPQVDEKLSDVRAPSHNKFRAWPNRVHL